MTPSTSLIIPSKWTSCNAEWHKKESLLCLNTVNGRGLVFWRSSPYFMSISRLCISVPLSTSWTDFTVNSNFSANRRPYLQCFSWLKHWTKRFCADFSRWVVNRMQVITNKIHQNTLIKGIRIFFPENSTDFVFQKLPEEIQSKIVYFYSVINEYSLRSRDMTLHAILLTKMIRF